MWAIIILKQTKIMLQTEIFSRPQELICQGNAMRTYIEDSTILERRQVWKDVKECLHVGILNKSQSSQNKT